MSLIPSAVGVCPAPRFTTSKSTLKLATQVIKGCPGPGTIDADYRGELKVLLINLGQETVMLNPRERIAQLVIAPIQQVEWELVESLGTTERGVDGFGSTGR